MGKYFSKLFDNNSITKMQKEKSVVLSAQNSW